MMNSSLHTISKQTLHFNYNGNANGFALQKEVSDWCNLTLIPEIERQLDTLDLGDNFVSIDKLEIEATANSSDWKSALFDELISKLRIKLKDCQPTLAATRLAVKSYDEKLDELILFYFENGYLPWWGKPLVGTGFETLFRSWVVEKKSDQRTAHIRAKLNSISSYRSIERLINQIPENLFFTCLSTIYTNQTDTISSFETFFRESIASQIPPEKLSLLTRLVFRFALKLAADHKAFTRTDLILQFLNNQLVRLKLSPELFEPGLTGSAPVNDPVLKEWQKLLVKSQKQQPFAKSESQQVDSENYSTPETRSEKQDLHSGGEINLSVRNDEQTEHENRFQQRRSIDKLSNPEIQEPEKKEFEPTIQESIFIENAGAVILAAFLPALFSQLKISEFEAIIKPDQAVRLVQYSVSGTNYSPEYELVLPKILCGFDIDFPINSSIHLTELQMAEAEEMLKALIAHWSVLKNTSTEGLRESFLKRNGKLKLSENGYMLQVEQKPYDMLLQQLPWNISMIKLPWMTNLLKTDWV